MLNSTRNLSLLIASSVTLCSCASLSLGPYSYDTQSKPVTEFTKTKNQEVVTKSKFSIPLESVCRLATVRHGPGKLLGKEKKSFGSAALIENRFLLTAAHNVFDYPFSKLMSVSVTCGDVEIETAKVVATLNREQIKQQVHVPRYEFRWPNTRKKFEFDYAFIDLGKTLSQSSSFVLSPKSSGKSSNIVNISGYPGGGISGERKRDGQQLYKGTSSQIHTNLNLITYNIETKTGNSGGPIWVGERAPYQIIAVHVNDFGGRRVEKTLLKDWNDWRKKSLRISSP